MRFKFFFGGKPKLTQADTDYFNTKEHRCSLLMQDKAGRPVAISQHKGTGTWRVQFGFSTCYFASYDEALAFCKGRFFMLDGKRV